MKLLAVLCVQPQTADFHIQLFYDTGCDRAWLTDGASALLHIARTQVVRRPYGGDNTLFNKSEFNAADFNHPDPDGGPNAAATALNNDLNMKHKILREFDSYAEEKIDWDDVVATEQPSHSTAKSTAKSKPSGQKRRQEIYKTTCFKELVCQTWSTLEHIYDRQMEEAMNHTLKQLHCPLQATLEGYEYMGIVSAKHVLTRRAANLHANGAAWLPLIKRIHAITLFGKHFGELYKPNDCSRETLCKQWTSVPRGQEYLVAPVSLLKEIKQNSVEEGEVDEDSHELVEGVSWSPSTDGFKQCDAGCKHILNGRVQRLSLKGKQTAKSSLFTTGCPDDGAVLFGESSILNVLKMQQATPGTLDPDSAFDDSGLGTSYHSTIGTIATLPSDAHLDISRSDENSSPQLSERPGEDSQSSSGGNVITVSNSIPSSTAPDSSHILSDRGQQQKPRPTDMTVVRNAAPTKPAKTQNSRPKKTLGAVWRKLVSKPRQA